MVVVVVGVVVVVVVVVMAVAAAVVAAARGSKRIIRSALVIGVACRIFRLTVLGADATFAALGAVVAVVVVVAVVAVVVVIIAVMQRRQPLVQALPQTTQRPQVVGVHLQVCEVDSL